MLVAVDLSLDGVRACPAFDFGGSVTPNRLIDLYGRGVAVIGIGADLPAKVTVNDGAAVSRRTAPRLNEVAEALLPAQCWYRCSGSDLIYPVNI